MLDGITDSMDMSFEQTPRDSEAQGTLVHCSPWGCRESDTTEQLNSSNTRLLQENRRETFDSFESSATWHSCL